MREPSPTLCVADVVGLNLTLDMVIFAIYTRIAGDKFNRLYRWQFEYSKANDTHWYWAPGYSSNVEANGGGGYWALPGVPFSTRISHGSKHIIKLPDSVDIARFIEEACETETRLEYCRVCDDWLLADDRPCHHLIRVDWGGYIGCGAVEDGISPETHRSSLDAYLLRYPAALRPLRQALAMHQYGKWPSRSLLNIARPHGVDIDGDDEDTDEEAVAWLRSLEAGETDEFDDTTVGWIDNLLARLHAGTVEGEEQMWQETDGGTA